MGKGRGGQGKGGEGRGREGRGGEGGEGHTTFRNVPAPLPSAYVTHVSAIVYQIQIIQY